MSPKLAIETLTRDEVDALLRACSRRAPSGLRDRALVAVLYGAGLRIAEALALRPRDLDLDHGSILVRRGKGGKQRTVGLPEGFAAIVRDWLRVRDDLDARRNHPVFCLIQHDRVGRSLAQANVRQMLRRRAARAGLDKRVHPHGFRHSHAAELARRRVPLVHVQAQLGHANAATTSRYIAHVSAAETVEVVRHALSE